MDPAAKRARKPLWKFLADAEPEWLVAQIDFRYIADALDSAGALALLRNGRRDRAGSELALIERGYPAYTTSSSPPVSTMVASSRAQDPHAAREYYEGQRPAWSTVKSQNLSPQRRLPVTGPMYESLFVVNGGRYGQFSVKNLACGPMSHAD
jgi:hypothetical protein